MRWAGVQKVAEERGQLGWGPQRVRSRLAVYAVVGCGEGRGPSRQIDWCAAVAAADGIRKVLER